MFLSNDLLAFAIEREFPGAKQWENFWVGFPNIGGNGVQAADAEIVSWEVHGVHRPDDVVGLAQKWSSEFSASKAAPRFIGNQKLDLFTQEEQLEVASATMTDPVVKLMYDRLLGAAYWSYEDAETEQGLSLLVSKGLLTAERKAEIVAKMQSR